MGTVIREAIRLFLVLAVGYFGLHVALTFPTLGTQVAALCITFGIAFCVSVIVDPEGIER